MTIPELLKVCDAAQDHVKNFGDPIAWLNFRRLVGPVEIRLLLEEHAAVDAALEHPIERDRGATKIAHTATDAALGALVMPDPEAPLGQVIETGTRERIHNKVLSHE